MTDNPPEELAAEDMPLTRRERRALERAAEATEKAGMPLPPLRGPAAPVVGSLPVSSVDHGVRESIRGAEASMGLAPETGLMPREFPMIDASRVENIRAAETGSRSIVAPRPAVLTDPGGTQATVKAAARRNSAREADTGSRGGSGDEPGPLRGRTKPRKRHDLWRTVGAGFSVGLLALIIGLAAVTIIVPRMTGSTALTVLTGSMRPGLPPGTLVVIKPMPTDQIRIGNVVTYEPNPQDAKELVTHRVTAITTGTDGRTVFTVQGDANNTPDAPVSSKQIVGVLWYSVPWFGWVNNFMGHFRSAIVLPVAVVALLAYALWAILSGIISRRRKKASRATPGEPGNVTDTLGVAD